jgi:hypothetical protein
MKLPPQNPAENTRPPRATSHDRTCSRIISGEIRRRTAQRAGGPKEQCEAGPAHPDRHLKLGKAIGSVGGTIAVLRVRIVN